MERTDELGASALEHLDHLAAQAKRPAVGRFCLATIVRTGAAEVRAWREAGQLDLDGVVVECSDEVLGLYLDVRNFDLNRLGAGFRYDFCRLAVSGYRLLDVAYAFSVNRYNARDELFLALPLGAGVVSLVWSHKWAQYTAFIDFRPEPDTVFLTLPWRLFSNMITIRLQRRGRKNDPSFRVIVVDSKKKSKTGNYLEMVGSYDPRVNRVDLKGDRIKDWMSHGATVSGTVHNLLVSNKIIDAKKINVLPKKTAPKKEVVAEAPKAAPVAAAPVAPEATTPEAVAPEAAAAVEDNAVAPTDAAE